MITAHHVCNVVVTIEVKEFDDTKPIRFKRFVSVFRWRCFVVDKFKQKAKSFGDPLL
jgi:hypothetical protein